jgi:hypothetical protein
MQQWSLPLLFEYAVDWTSFLIENQKKLPKEKSFRQSGGLLGTTDP